MTLELEEVRDFLAQDPPFSTLPLDELATLATRMDMIYAKRGSQVIAAGEDNHFLYIIRSGAVDVTDSDGTLLDRRDTGGTFGYSTLNGPVRSEYTIAAVEDCLLLRLPRAEFQRISAAHPALDEHFAVRTSRIRAAAERLRDDATTEALRTHARDFLDPDPATVTSGASIRRAAEVMDERAVSALLIIDAHVLVGILTDRDLRRMIAQGGNPEVPVSELMTANPVTIAPETFAFEAMLVMAERGIHHLPVVDGGAVIGVVTSASIVNLLRQNPMYLTADLGRATTPEEMADTFRAASEMAARLVDRGASPHEASSLLAVAADAVARRLLVLAEEKLGPPPVPYCFVVVGSQGRRGMGFASDQDNCLVLSDDYLPEHEPYFAELSRFVCEGLSVAGQARCPGDMMAMNPTWRKTCTEWINTFRAWITAPEPEALLHAQTFFDFRGIHGDLSLATEVHSVAVEMAAHAPRLRAHLAALAARREPPLSFFRGLVVERSGDYAHTLDVKKGGIAAVVQMARLYALCMGSTEVGTEQRLRAAAGTGVSESGAQNLLDAFEFLQAMALRWQSEQLRRGDRPSYHIDPQALSKTDRERLRDAFHIIKSMQTALATKYPVRSI
ncbi:putative nucleotidyltransferase substrate binding domain-containing protein [Staphylococcus chromogenes]|nr:putative nucleotidyltransferase substrate binding domain-containing protein [Staphylococcus chromogenes]